jgi:hypothetical protein
MDMAQFKGILNANDWKNRLSAIIFDNSMRFVFDQREYTERQTATSVVREVTRYIPPEEVLLFDDAHEAVGMVERFVMKDRTNPLYEKAKFITWRPVECVQAIVFCPEDCLEIRPHFDVNMM